MNGRTLLFVGAVSLAVAATASAQSYGGTRTQPSQPSTPSQTSQANDPAQRTEPSQPMKDMGQAQDITGTVVSSGGSTLVVDTDSGRRTFIVDSESRVPSNLTAGSRVTVTFHTLDGGRFHAASVTSMGAEPMGSQATSTQGTMGPGGMGPTQSITGTIVSTSGSRLVLNTDSGRRTFIVDNESSVPSDLVAGNRVSVDFHALSGGRFHAATVTSLAPSASTMGATTTTAETETATAGTRTRTARNLPATASDLPSIGLVGVLALGAGLLVRRYRAV